MTMTINSNTKIGAILKEAPGALDAIIEINAKFEKLRNPILRRLMAGRTTLASASKFGNCELEDFYKKLEPFGFEIDRSIAHTKEEKQVPEFMSCLVSRQLTELDVRPVLASGEDPLNIIMSKIKTIEPGGILKIINSFEPTPLILLLEKKGFETYVEHISSDHVNTYFYKRSKSQASLTPKTQNAIHDWDDMVKRYESRISRIDVRELEMPQPMMKILEALDHMANDTALMVYHKRIPVFLLPELEQRGYEYRIKEISDNEVHLVIFRN
jgi:uncharacterized protein (DUF2249 family)